VYAGGGLAIYVAANQGGLDLRNVVRKFDTMVGTAMGDRLDTLDPRLGNIAVALACNELMEPVRLPLALLIAVRIGSRLKK